MKIIISRLTIFFLLLTLCFFSCRKDFTNKKNYNIRIGETFKLFISENSCCQNCWIDKANLKSIEFEGRKLEEPADSDCDGCSSYYSWIFKGVGIGTDTIKITQISGGDKCSDYNANSSKIKIDIFIITVSP
jgi:predicted secreted protein